MLTQEKEKKKVSTMKAAQINKYGNSEVVEINNNVSTPKPSSGKVLVKIYAAGVNPTDWKIREGYMKDSAPLNFPATLGFDFSGTIEETGEGITGFRDGDEVYGQASLFKDGSGSFAEFAVANEKNIALKPKNIRHVEAAALPLVGVSAFQVLTNHIGLGKGDKILIHGGTGGIGTIAIQLAKHLGAYVATTVNIDDVQLAKELGADLVVDYKKQNFEDYINQYDAVFDTVGGETYKRSFKVIKSGGIIVSMIEQPNEELMKQYKVKAIGQFTKVTTADLSKLTELMEQRAIKVYIDKVFPLDYAAEALRYQQKGHPKGKVVIEVIEER